MNLHRSVFNRVNPAWPLLAALLLAPLPAAADTEGVPAVVLELLPPTEKITQQEGGIYEDEMGNNFSWQMSAVWPGKYPDCYASRYNSVLSVDIQGDWAWADETLAEQLTEQYEMDLEDARLAMSEDLPDSIYNQSKGKFFEETLPSGSIFVTELTEDCDGRANSTLTIVQGYALHGPSILDVSLMLNAPSAEAKAMVTGILDRFEKLDIEALTR